MARIQWHSASCFVLALFLSNTTFAKEQEVQLEVQNMTCASCYYMVNKVLLDVDGVLEVEFPYAVTTNPGMIVTAVVLMAVPKMFKYLNWG